MVTTVVDEDTGEERKRLINKMRWKGYGPAAIQFSDPVVCSHISCARPNHPSSVYQVPEQPPQSVENARASADQKLLAMLSEVLMSSYHHSVLTASPAHRSSTSLDTHVTLQSVHRLGSARYTQVRLLRFFRYLPEPIRSAAPRSSFLSFVTFSKMGHGETRSYGLGTTPGRTRTRGCAS
jgi:hypothetical protein